jgi:hypothetical protein
MAEDHLPRSTLMLAHVLNGQFPLAQSLPMASTSAAVVSPDNALPPHATNGPSISPSNVEASSSHSSPMHRGDAAQINDVDLDHELEDHDPDSASSTSLKRLASPEFESSSTAKRKREDGDECLEDGDEDDEMDVSGSGSDGEQARSKAKDKDAVARIDGEALAEHLAQELQCGCCSELVYKPVIVTPCQHFFCGR